MKSEATLTAMPEKYIYSMYEFSYNLKKTISLIYKIFHSLTTVKETLECLLASAIVPWSRTTEIFSIWSLLREGHGNSPGAVGW